MPPPPALQVLQTSVQPESSGVEREGGDGGEGENGDTTVSTPALMLALPKLFIRLYGYEPVTPLKNLKAPLYGMAHPMNERLPNTRHAVCV